MRRTWSFKPMLPPTTPETLASQRRGALNFFLLQWYVNVSMHVYIMCRLLYICGLCQLQLLMTGSNIQCMGTHAHKQ